MAPCEGWCRRAWACTPLLNFSLKLLWQSLLHRRRRKYELHDSDDISLDQRAARCRSSEGRTFTQRDHHPFSIERIDVNLNLRRRTTCKSSLLQLQLHHTPRTTTPSLTSNNTISCQPPSHRLRILHPLRIFKSLSVAVVTLPHFSCQYPYSPPFPNH